MQEVLGPCEAKDGTNIDELLQEGAGGHKRAWQDVRRNSDSRRRQGSLPKRPKIGRLMEKKRRITWKEKRRPSEEFEMGEFMAPKGLWSLAKEKILQDRGALPKEECDTVREYKAMHEEHFLSSWLREVGEEKEEIIMETGKETKEEMGKKRRREEEKEENETVFVKRRCVGSVSVEAFDIFILWLIGL